MITSRDCLGINLLRRCSRWIVAKQEAELVNREALGKLLFAQDVVRERGFCFLQSTNFLLDAVLDEEPIRNHVALLPDAMGTIDRLVFDRRIPPRIEEHD